MGYVKMYMYIAYLTAFTISALVSTCICMHVLVQRLCGLYGFKNTYGLCIDVHVHSLAESMYCLCAKKYNQLCQLS